MVGNWEINRKSKWTGSEGQHQMVSIVDGSTARPPVETELSLYEHIWRMKSLPTGRSNPPHKEGQQKRAAVSTGHVSWEVLIQSWRRQPSARCEMNKRKSQRWVWIYRLPSTPPLPPAQWHWAQWWFWQSNPFSVRSPVHCFQSFWLCTSFLTKSFLPTSLFYWNLWEIFFTDNDRVITVTLSEENYACRRVLPVSIPEGSNNLLLWQY